MSAMKHHMMQVEEAVWEAMEKGAVTKDDIYAYVQMLVPFANRGYVDSMVDIYDDYGYEELSYYGA